jgi:hypothetical protein
MLMPLQESAASSGECAAKCGDECDSAVWQYTRKLCLLYHSPVNMSPHSRGSVYLKPLAPSDPLPTDGESECQLEKEACEDELGHQRENLERCKHEKEGLQLENSKVQQENKDLVTKTESCQLERDDFHTKNEACQLEKVDFDTKNKACQLAKR